MSKPPPFLLGAAVLFWGWQSGFLLPATVMACVLESAQVVKARWDFAEEDFTRIWVFCSLLLLAAAIYAFSASDAPADLVNMVQNPNLFNQRRVTTTSSKAVASLIRWQPMIFFPFITAQTFSSREGVPLQTISLILQRRWKKARKLGRKPPASVTVNLGHAYLVLCVFSASIHPSENTAFFWGLALLIAWALWPQRSRRFALPVWAALLLAVIGLGYAGQLGVRQAQYYLGNFNPRWFLNNSRRGFDPSKNRTSLGQVGRLKQSGQITLRVETKEAGRVPPLLREASYRSYRAQAWYSGNSRLDFEQVKDTNVNSYVLAPGQYVTTALRVACYLPGGQGLLPLPEGTARLENLPAFVVSKNKCGAVLVDGPGLVIFEALHGPGISFDSPPEESLDSAGGVPLREAAALSNVVSMLSLEGKPLPQVMRTLSAWFATNFTYSIWEEPPTRRERERGDSPLTRFLLKTRKGHCEYFATATVLLLRQLGFPARYAVGYAVHESAGGNKYVVRQRDAHAWCLVWRDGIWRDFDTTPGSWLAHEAQRASSLQGLSDFWSRLVFEFSKIRYGETHLRRYILYGLAVVLALLLYQILFSKKRRRSHSRTSPARPAPSWPGLDSEFYRLERALASRGLARNLGEPLSAWLARSASDSALTTLGPELQALLALHYRYRFDPLGLTPDDRERLRLRVERCLSRLSPEQVPDRRFA